ncbi:MAG: PD-(D/E)XK nuclease family protein [Dysgonamonadaceae bacterium]|jgi:CRISPR/Cas system-associated exonuclease Cas4 (RecB family)|nr:PD-(D/E)XK nuclease family protein [Dysgonamonadaceae bacterium]
MNFLYRIAQKFYAEYGNELYRHTFVFPNRRAGVFFQKYLAEIAGKPLFSPSIITIQEFFESLSDYQSADKIEMLVMLYKHYVHISKTDETFDDFLYWSEMLLNDFNDVDKYLVDAKQLFKNISDLRSLDGDMSYLTDVQVEAIRRFWTDFMPIEGNDTKKKFQETWQILFELYTSFRAELHEKGYAYEGMLFREIAEKTKAKKELSTQFSDIVFVGLNALTPSETKLLDYLRVSGVADFYWDYDSPFVRDEQNRASFWVTENLNRFPSKFDIKNDEKTSSERPVVELIGIPSGVGQAKQVTNILSQLIASNKITNPNEAINTAIVLPDKNLLLPLLYSIPQEIGKINVTMGYGLQNASGTSLIEHIAGLQQNIRKSGENTMFYYRFVLSILNHQLVALAARKNVEMLKTHILKNNRIVVSAQELQIHQLLKLIFKPITHWQDIPEYLKSILSYLYNVLTGEKHAANDDDPHSARPIDLEREFIVQYYKAIVRLQDTLRDAGEMSVETYFRLLKKVVQGINVSFSGEPLSGLQIMGVLETRALDFDNLIILSMNEGVFPTKNHVNSFIPYSLRRAFELPTHEHQDSVYAYHFYRMISRAHHVFLLYDTRAEEMQTGEVSRYFYQLKYLYNSSFNISEQIVSYDVSAPEIASVSVTKTAETLQKLDKFRVDGDKSFSASLINNYINCPLQFYFTAVEGLSEEDEVQETVEAAEFGSIFHRVMENIYNRLKDAPIVPDTLSTIAKDDAYLISLIEKAFARYYFKDEHNPQPLQGQHYLIGEILRSYVRQTLEMDKQFTPFEYIDSEFRFNQPYRVNEALSVNFKGSIDRIDKVNGTYRVIDYKTGSGPTDFRDIEQLFDASKNNRPYQILQVFIYALFYKPDDKNFPVSPAIYYLRSIFKDFNPSISYNKNRIDDISTYLPEFTEQLNVLFEEIFNPHVPFSQTLNEKNCEWCAFKDVCGR